MGWREQGWAIIQYITNIALDDFVAVVLNEPISAVIDSINK